MNLSSDCMKPFYPSWRRVQFAATRYFAGLLITLFLADLTQAADKVQYNRDIRPILSENCFACHGLDGAAREADLRLDQREAAVEFGALVPGEPDESELIARVFSESKHDIMPPPKSHKTLTQAQKDLLRRWVAEGAEYEPHWSLIAPKRPALPEIKNRAWVKNPIDAFILARLEAVGLSPAAEADRRTLARRASLDITGLPPAPAEVEAFVNDSSADAYEKYVDRLLASPHWGEHRGRYWLDAARYADTHGIHFDNFREMWTYRDWVINALNQNMPFDQFTIEQLAGDLLPNPTLEQRIASGFNRCNITTNEGGVIPEEYLVLYTRDRTETTSLVWMGLTAGCAVCHDHKFDPISQREFYEMAAFFNNTTQGAMDGNIKDTPPIVFVPTDQDRPRWDALSKELADAKTQIESRKQAARADYDQWLAGAKQDAIATSIPSEGLSFHAPLQEGDKKQLHVVVDGKPRTIEPAKEIAWGNGHIAEKAFKSRADLNVEIADAGNFEKDKGFSFGAWVRLPKDGMTGAVFARMEEAKDHRGWDLWLEGGRVGTHIINHWPNDAIKVVSKNPVKKGEWNHLFVTYDGSGKAEGVKIFVNGQPQATDLPSNNLKNTIKTEVPLKIAQRHASARLDGLLIQDLRLYGRTLPNDEVDRLAKASRAVWLANKPADKRTDAEKDELFVWWLTSVDKPYQELSGKLAGLAKEEGAIKSRGTIAHVMQEKGEPPTSFMLFRGEYDKRRDQVQADTPDALPPMPGDLPRNRLGFAQWLLRPEHPLTTRVTVNRFWQEVFGTGLVRTAGDFGVTGELPSHPELLDWMAVEFRESGWDMKKFFKLMVTSATYRQSAAVTPEKLEKDPDNRLHARGPRFRLDGELIRDYALAASGLLVRKLGGPSVKPYQPDGVWEAVAMIGSNTRDYKRDSGENLYRRSLYTFWKRSAPPASMEIFNAPAREVCTVRRERTNTPLQALVTLNDEQFIEAARQLAQLAIKEGGSTPESRIEYITRRLLARSLRPEESEVTKASFNDLLAYYQANEEDAKKLIAVGESKPDPTVDPKQLAAWTMLTNQLMNLDEVLCK